MPRSTRTPEQLGRQHWNYVYLLVDPRGDRVFYVGKGRLERLLHHELEARRGLLTRKCQVIRDIWAAGLKVEKRIVALFKSDRAAREYELFLIHTYRYSRLTNGSKMFSIDIPGN